MDYISLNRESQNHKSLMADVALESYLLDPYTPRELQENWINGEPDFLAGYSHIQFTVGAVKMDFAIGKNSYFSFTYSDGSVLHIEDDPKWCLVYRNEGEQSMDQGWGEPFDSEFPAHPDFWDNDEYPPMCPPAERGTPPVGTSVLESGGWISNDEVAGYQRAHLDCVLAVVDKLKSGTVMTAREMLSFVGPSLDGEILALAVLRECTHIEWYTRRHVDGQNERVYIYQPIREIDDLPRCCPPSESGADTLSCSLVSMRRAEVSVSFTAASVKEAVQKAAQHLNVSFVKFSECYNRDQTPIEARGIDGLVSTWRCEKGGSRWYLYVHETAETLADLGIDLPALCPPPEPGEGPGGLYRNETSLDRAERKSKNVLEACDELVKAVKRFREELNFEHVDATQAHKVKAAASTVDELSEILLDFTTNKVG